MKVIVTHTSPDWDAIGGVWLLKKFLPGWQEAKVEFVPAGERSDRVKSKKTDWEGPIEKIGEDQIIHVDTGLGPLDHHQTSDTTISGTGLTWDFIKMQFDLSGNQLSSEHKESVSRVVRFIVDTDHFKEVFWQEPAADYHEFTLLGLLEGLKQEIQDNDLYYIEFGITCLNAMTHTFESRIWAEKEIKEKGIKFETKFGPAMGFETINDTVLKLAQKMGYQLVIRKDPRKGYIRIKALPEHGAKKGIDLTLAYEKLKKIDPDATWFLHVSKKMLLNGSPKNPKMRPTKLTLIEIIKVLQSIY